MRYLLYAGTVAILVFYLFFPLPNRDIHLNCDNVSHIIVSKFESLPDEYGHYRDLYMLTVLLRQSKINLRREVLQCGEDVANIWAGESIVHRQNVRELSKRQTFSAPGSISIGRDSVLFVRATEDEAFALARAICAKKTDPELRP